MARVEALRVIAMMTDKKSPWYRPLNDFPNDTTYNAHLWSNIYSALAALIFIPKPKPTIFAVAKCDAVSQARGF